MGPKFTFEEICVRSYYLFQVLSEFLQDGKLNKTAKDSNRANCVLLYTIIHKISFGVVRNVISKIS